jgi:hypothetical protein
MLTRSILTLTSLFAFVAACGDDGGTTPPMPDAAPDIGFNKPTATLKANNNEMEVGPADLTCLNMPSADQAVSIPEVMLSTTVRDFQNNSIVPNAMVTAFRGVDVNQPFDTQTANAMGEVTIRIPMDTKRFGFKMKDPSSLDTLLLNQIVAPDMATQTLGAIQTVSQTTATLLPALINKQRTLGTGVLAGAVRDCQDRELSNFIATVSSTKGTVTHLPGADTYYFDPVAGLPVRHNQRGSASADGLFMVIEMPPAATAYVQVWGYPTDADLAGDQLKLIAELQTPVIADTVITGSYEPLRTGP